MAEVEIIHFILCLYMPIFLASIFVAFSVLCFDPVLPGKAVFMATLLLLLSVMWFVTRVAQFSFHCSNCSVPNLCGPLNQSSVPTILAPSRAVCQVAARSGWGPGTALLSESCQHSVRQKHNLLLPESHTYNLSPMWTVPISRCLCAPWGPG